MLLVHARNLSYKSLIYTRPYAPNLLNLPHLLKVLNPEFRV
jgi:hypothetical protein